MGNCVSELEQFLSAAGIVIHRVSPISDIYPLAHTWLRENNPREVDDVVFPVSKYQQFRLARC